MNYFKTRNKKIILIITAFAVLFIALVTTFLLLSSQKQNTTPISTAVFSFDGSVAPGWWTPGNYTTTQEDINNPERIDTDPLPIASINAFQGKQNEHSDGCFVMAFYQKGAIDIDTALSERTASMIAGQENNASVEQTETTKQRIQTPQGLKEYTYYQFDIKAPVGQQLQRGAALGFIQLQDHYIEIRGVCPTANMLANTLVGLKAISLR